MAAKTDAANQMAMAILIGYVTSSACSFFASIIREPSFVVCSGGPYSYDTGMRLREVLGLRWSQVNLKLGVIKLSAEDTKTEEPRTVFLTSRVREALEAQPRHIKSDWVFTNPGTEEAWKDIRKIFRRACKAAKLTGVWFHDLRRSFVTNARRRGVPEWVVMRMSGHRTRAVFDRYNIVEEDDLREAVKRIEAGTSGLGHDLVKVAGTGASNDEGPTS